MLGPAKPTSRATLGVAGRIGWLFGYALRETGLALDRAGHFFQGKMAHDDEVPRHRRVMPVFAKRPSVPLDAFIAPSASVVGDVVLRSGASVWYGAVVRGDVSRVTIGSGTNIQDACVVHGTRDPSQGRSSVKPMGDRAPGEVVIGDNVTVGHGATVHAAEVKDGAMVGMNATVLDDVVVGEGAIVGAGSVVTSGTEIPAGELWAGVPAARVRRATAEDIAAVKDISEAYVKLSAAHAAEAEKSWEQLRSENVARLREKTRDPDFDAHIGLAQRLAREKETPSRYHT